MRFWIYESMLSGDLQEMCCASASTYSYIIPCFKDQQKSRNAVLNIRIGVFGQSSKNAAHIAAHLLLHIYAVSSKIVD